MGSLGNTRRRRWCETYVRGVLLDGPRKSIEPMAARLQKIESGAEDYEQALQQFINQSPWDEQAVLDGLQRWIGLRFCMPEYLILDDIGIPKQGTHSVDEAPLTSTGWQTRRNAVTPTTSSYATSPNDDLIAWQEWQDMLGKTQPDRIKTILAGIGVILLALHTHRWVNGGE